MNESKVNHWKQIIEEARKSRKGLTTVKEGVEFSPFIKALIGVNDDNSDREDQDKMES